MKVLQLVENLHRGSVERWLIRIFLHAKDMGLPFEWTFYCYLPECGDLQRIAEEAGARVVHSPVPLSAKMRFLSALRAEIQRGDHDVVHSHHDFLSTFYYVASIGCGIRRVTHVHNTDELLPASPMKRAMLLEPMRQICLRMSDRILGTSEHALKTFLAGRAVNPKRDHVHYCCIGKENIFSPPADRVGVRAELGLEPVAKLLLFVGAMIDLKNPLALVEMLPHFLVVDPGFAVVFVGKGPDQARVRKRAEELRVGHRIKVLGWREDVERLMLASDLFVNPRREQPPEAFGLVNVEAQAAGLRALVSDGISPEPLLNGTLHARIPLALGPVAWAKAALELLAMPALPRETTKDILLNSPFNPDFAVKDLHAIYAGLIRD